MFFVTLKIKGGHFDPLLTQKPKKLQKMKFCTVIAYYNTSIIKQLKFLNSHCSIVCGYCSVLCLTAKTIVKNDQIFKFFQIKRNSQG